MVYLKSIVSLSSDLVCSPEQATRYLSHTLNCHHMFITYYSIFTFISQKLLLLWKIYYSNSDKWSFESLNNPRYCICL